MDEGSTESDPVAELQALGLKEYEAKTLVALIRLGGGTAKDVSEASTVPRTRVYDAVRVLEAKGLIEVQHASPQRFRPVPVTEALATLERQYRDRFRDLETALERLDRADGKTDPTESEVWTLNDATAIASRVDRLIDEAESEVVLVAAASSPLDDDLVARIEAAVERGVRVGVGVLDDAMGDRVRERLSGVEVFTSGLEWLEPAIGVAEASIGLLVLVDGETILVSSVGSEREEHAVFASGVTNGFVVISRRLLLTGTGGDPLAGED